MRIASPNRYILVDDGHYLPFNRYVVCEADFALLTERTPNTNWLWSSFNSYERRYGGQDLNGKTVCIYRHAAFGDQLIVSAVPHYLKARYPEARIHLYCHASVHSLWHYNPFVDGAALPLPMPFDAVREYDYHIFFEGMLEGNSEKDQGCCYDDMFNFIGCRNVPDSFKRPYFETRPEDYIEFNRCGIKRKYLLYHLSPANPNRMYPWDQGMKFIKLFHQQFPDWNVVIVGKKTLATGRTLDVRVSEFMEVGGYPWLIDLTDKTSSFRQLAPFIENASCVVCPDSSVLHLAACYPDVPTYSLWGVFHPDDRAKYYTNVRTLTAFQVCPHAPCRNHNFELPMQDCAHAQGTTTEYCRALAAITPEELLTNIMIGGVR